MKRKRASVRALAAFVAAALLAGQLPGGQCVMAHEDDPHSGAIASTQAADVAAHHHTAPSSDASTSQHQNDGAESSECTMLVSCGAPALAHTAIALKAIQANSIELTLSVATQHLNPTLFSLTPPPRA